MLNKNKKYIRRRIILILILALVLGCAAGGFYAYAQNKKNAQIAAEQAKIKEEQRLKEEKAAAEKAAQEKAAADKEAADKAAADKAAQDKASAAAAVSNPKGTNYREFFKQDAFMGDSISEGLFFYDYLDESRVIAKKGMSITGAPGYVDNVISLKPNRVFLMFGVNNMDDRTSSKWFSDQYLILINKIREKLPNVQIYVQSVMPVREEIVHKTNTHINNVHINECNEALKAMVKEQGFHYINVGSLLNDSNKNLYEVDGIHFKSEFYPLWLNYIESQLVDKKQ